ncbi:MAG: hypothetical protein ACLQNG_11510 [Acidimicrobiales bacterium]
MGIGRNEFLDVTAAALDELAGQLERIDRRVALLLGANDLEPGSTPNLDRLRQYVAEVRAQKTWEANEHVRLEVEAAARRKDEAASVGEIWRNRQAIDAAQRAGLISGMGRPR